MTWNNLGESLKSGAFFLRRIFLSYTYVHVHVQVYVNVRMYIVWTWTRN
jgi:hypothetical protein